MITNESINRAIDYILLHIEDVTLEEVASYCHFSKYYFCRLFKAQTGESVHSFIKRVRLEQSAFRLKVSRSVPLRRLGQITATALPITVRLSGSITRLLLLHFAEAFPVFLLNIPFFTGRNGGWRALRSVTLKSQGKCCRIIM